MFSFFSQKKLRVNNPAALGTGCGSCKGRTKCKSPNMQPIQCGERVDILFIKDNPSLKEDNNSAPFVGSDIKVLKNMYKDVTGSKLDNYALCYAIGCYSRDDKVLNANVRNCYKKLWWYIDKYKPKVIVPMGMNGVRALLFNRWWNGDKFGEYNTMWIDWAIPDQRLGCWILPIYNPSFADRESEKNPVMEVLFGQQIQRIAHVLSDGYFPVREEEKVSVLLKEKETCQFLEKLIDGEYGYTHAIDFEATGLKPYNSCQELLCIGISTGLDSAAVVRPLSDTVIDLLCDFMSNEHHKKIAHNLPFEDTWFHTKYGTQIKGWIWDTRIVAHAINNNKGITGLKFQAYVNLGMEDYSTHLDVYMRAKEEDVIAFGDNAINTNKEAPIEELMKYCGLDCVATHRLFQVQYDQIWTGGEMWTLR